MSFIHTIVIANEVHGTGTVSSTRKSENRRYAACVVATATEATVRIAAERKAELETTLAGLRVQLAELEAKYGTTLAEVRAWHKGVEDRWHDGGSANPVGYHATKERIAKEQGFDRYSLAEALTLAELAKRGLTKPFEAGTKYDVQAKGSEVDRCEGALERHRTPAVGQSAVITWCGTVALAHKACGGRDAKYFSERGWALAVRADITVRETAKRAAKAVST